MLLNDIETLRIASWKITKKRQGTEIVSRVCEGIWWDLKEIKKTSKEKNGNEYLDRRKNSFFIIFLYVYIHMYT